MVRRSPPSHVTVPSTRRRSEFRSLAAGLENRTSLYDEDVDYQLKKQLVERPPTYLLAKWTYCRSAIRFIAHCHGAGPTVARVRAFFKYVTETMVRKQTPYRPGVRAQRSLHVHDRHRVSVIFPQ